MRFASPGFYEEHVRVDVRPEELRRSSVRSPSRSSARATRLVAEGWGTLVGYDYAAGRAAPFPESIATLLPRSRDGKSSASTCSPARPHDLDEHESGRLEQGYLALDPAGAGVRVRRKGAKTR